MTKSGKRGPVDQRLLDLYDQYAHGFIDRRAFVRRAGMLAVGGMSAAALVESVLPRYADAETISFTDPRIHAEYVDYPSPDGTSGKMRGYLVKPARATGRFRPFSSSTRTGASIPISRTWRAAPPCKASSLWRPTGSPPSAAIRGTTTRDARCNPNSTPRSSTPT
jgi:hypothetical protein